jgi:hypothetical protein
LWELKRMRFLSIVDGHTVKITSCKASHNGVCKRQSILL